MRKVSKSKIGRWVDYVFCLAKLNILFESALLIFLSVGFISHLSVLLMWALSFVLTCCQNSLNTHLPPRLAYIFYIRPVNTSWQISFSTCLSVNTQIKPSYPKPTNFHDPWFHRECPVHSNVAGSESGSGGLADPPCSKSGHAVHNFPFCSIFDQALENTTRLVVFFFNRLKTLRGL